MFAKGVDPLSAAGISGMLELIGGVLLILGLFTRPVAFILSGLMAVAYFMAHAPGGFYPILNAGELAALYSFVFLFIAAAGAGPWSIDAMRKKQRPHRRSSPYRQVDPPQGCGGSRIVAAST